MPQDLKDKSGNIVFSHDKCVTPIELLKAARAAGVALVNLNLQHMQFNGQRISDFNLSGCALVEADFRGAIIDYVCFSKAEMSYVKFDGSIISLSDFSGADFYTASCRGVNFHRVDFSSATLNNSNFLGSIIDRECVGDEFIAAVAAQSRIVCNDTELFVYKKCRGGIIVKLRIPPEAKRSHSFGRKCRAEYADVVAIEGAEMAISAHDFDFVYRVGERVAPTLPFDPNWRQECRPGIHFFLTREEAEAY